MPEQTIRRLVLPDDFHLENGQIGIDVGPRTYGLICPVCGYNEFSEDLHFTVLQCGKCQAIVAIRAKIEEAH